MKTLKIDETEALRLYPTAPSELKSIFEATFGKEFFVPKKITDKVFDIDSLSDYLNIDEDDLYLFNKNTKDKHQRFINACNIIPKIVEIYNEGTILNWNNTNQYKYMPYKSFFGGSGVVHHHFWYSTLYCSGGFYLKSRELSEAIYKNFPELWEDYWNVKS